MPDQIAPVVWQPDRTPEAETWTMPELPVALGRGVRGLCPACGKTHAFSGYLTVVPECTNCHAPLGRFRADDAPPYFTILVTGHILVPLMLWVEVAYQPPIWLDAVVWLPTAALLCLGLLRPIKGAVLGWMMRLGIMKTED